MGAKVTKVPVQVARPERSLETFRVEKKERERSFIVSMRSNQVSEKSTRSQRDAATEGHSVRIAVTNTADRPNPQRCELCNLTFQSLEELTAHRKFSKMHHIKRLESEYVEKSIKAQTNTIVKEAVSTLLALSPRSSAARAATSEATDSNSNSGGGGGGGGGGFRGFNAPDRSLPTEFSTEMPSPPMVLLPTQPPLSPSLLLSPLSLSHTSEPLSPEPLSPSQQWRRSIAKVIHQNKTANMRTTLDAKFAVPNERPQALGCFSSELANDGVTRTIHLYLHEAFDCLEIVLYMPFDSVQGLSGGDGAGAGSSSKSGKQPSRGGLKKAPKNRLYMRYSVLLMRLELKLRRDVKESDLQDFLAPRLRVEGASHDQLRFDNTVADNTASKGAGGGSGGIGEEEDDMELEESAPLRSLLMATKPIGLKPAIVR